VNLFSAIARWNQRLRRLRIGRVRINWILLGFLAFGLYAALYNTIVRARQDPEPRLVPLAEIFSAKGATTDHVEVTGLLFPQTHLVYPAIREDRLSPIQYTYVAMIEDDAKRVLLVRFRGDFGRGEPRHATVSGLLVTPDATLRRYLKAKGWKIGGLPIEQRYFLFAGSRPVPVWLFVVVAAILALILGPLLVAEYRCLKVRE
jgi:hypothetical protein